MDEIFLKLLNIIHDKYRIKRNELLSKHTTLKIGGPAGIMVYPKNEDELSRILSLCRESDVNHYILGHGSNLLVSDKGYNGVIIKMDLFKEFSINGDHIAFQSGFSLVKASNVAFNLGLSGLEFACGIPGSIGGAVVMNAGAHGSSISDCFVCAKVMDNDGVIHIYGKEDMLFGYRKSTLQDNDAIIIDAQFKLEQASRDLISKKMMEYHKMRMVSQPLGQANAGCVFRNKGNVASSKLIDDINMKGTRVGGISISDIHAGFFVNNGNGTFNDFIKIIEITKKAVKEKYNISLDEEIRILK